MIYSRARTVHHQAHERPRRLWAGIAPKGMVRVAAVLACCIIAKRLHRPPAQLAPDSLAGHTRTVMQWKAAAANQFRACPLTSPPIQRGMTTSGCCVPYRADAARESLIGRESQTRGARCDRGGNVPLSIRQCCRLSARKPRVSEVRGAAKSGGSEGKRGGKPPPRPPPQAHANPDDGAQSGAPKAGGHWCV